MHKIIAKIKRELDDKGLIESNQTEVNKVLVNNIQPVEYVESVNTITEPENHKRASERAGYPTAGVTVTLDIDQTDGYDGMSDLTDELNEAIDEYQRTDGYTDTWSMRWYRTSEDNRFVIMAWYQLEME